MKYPNFLSPMLVIKSTTYGCAILMAIIGISFQLKQTNLFVEFIDNNWKELQPYASSIILGSSLFVVFGWLYTILGAELQISIDPETQDKIPNGKLMARAARSRASGKIPPAYPTGWYKVEHASNLKVGEVKYIEFFGEHLVLFRGENGKVAVLDAYCPHLGANLAVEGKVVGNCIECPFHGWQFESDGKCSSIPYVDKVPEIAKTKAWPTVEKNDGVYIYFDALGRLESQQWQVPDLELIQNKSFVRHGYFDMHVEAHIQEIPENGSDVAHLGVLHVPWALSKFASFITHGWTAEWRAGELPEEHIAHIKLTQVLRLWGKNIPFTYVSAAIRQIGPGIVYLELLSSFGKFIITEHVTPVQPLYQHVSHTIFGKPGIFQRIACQIMLRSFLDQFLRDVTIWNNKTYVHKPIIVKNDGNILGFRRWYSKFYPDLSNTTESEKLRGKQDVTW